MKKIKLRLLNFRNYIKISLIILVFTADIAVAQDKFEKFIPAQHAEYKIGTADFFIFDSAREEIFTKRKDDFRNLYVKAWYPAQNTSTKNTVYIPGKNYAAITTHYWWMGATRAYIRKLSNTSTNARVNAEISAKEKKYPVIIFSHGYGISLPNFYTFQLENLAANGYIVLAITHPYESIVINYPDGENTTRGNVLNLIKFNKKLKSYKNENEKTDSLQGKISLIKKIKEEAFFINRSHSEWVNDIFMVTNALNDSIKKYDWGVLEGKYNVEKIGVMGHSFGGSVAAQSCVDNNMIKAGINLDGWQYGDVSDKSLHCPFMFLGAEKNEWYQMFYNKSDNDFFNISLKIKHFSFSDMALYPGLPTRLKMKYLGNMHPENDLKYTRSIILSFFDHYLKDKDFTIDLSRIAGFSIKKEKEISSHERNSRSQPE